MAAARKTKEINYVKPDDTDWVDPCPGSVGSKENLTDIENQAAENRSAVLEKRAARPLAIRCGFCGNFHKEMQPSIDSIMGADTYAWNVPSPVEEPERDPELVAAAVDAVINTDSQKLEDSSKEEEPTVGPVEEDKERTVEDILNDDSNKQSAGNKSSDSSSS